MVYENGVHQICVVFSLHIQIDKTSSYYYGLSPNNELSGYTLGV